MRLAQLAGRTRRPGARRARGDTLAVVVLIVLPVLAFGLPALLGHAVVPGDDLTQNYPLRVLVGRQLASGHLPLFDPYIWSGAPLLGGWNAGAAYPLTLLFAVLPGVAAWTVNLIATWAVAGAGMFWFLRALRLSTIASFLGALTFAFAGAMPAQVGHFGLVAGMSWVPVQLLAVLRLSQPRALQSRLAWIAVLATAFGLTILAGEPRAVDNAGAIVVMYTLWHVARAGRRGATVVALSVVAGLALGACLGAVQLLPGLAAISTSQRAAGSLTLYNSGSLPPGWLLLMLVPDLLGGSGSVGQPAFFAGYQLAEVTSYVGILPLVAALAMLGRLRRRGPVPGWLVWHLIALAGIILALGGNTPAGQLLAHLPLFGLQRLQSRNIMITDTALAVLLAYWVDEAPRAVSRAAATAAGRCRWRADAATVLGVLAPTAVLVVAALAVWRTGSLLGWLAVSPAAIRAAGSLAPSVAPFAILAVAALVLVALGARLPARRRTRLIASFVVADVVVFTLLAVVAVLPASDHHTASAARAAQQGLRERAISSPVKPAGLLAHPGRFAIYDPGLIDASLLPVLASPDLNALSAAASVQGYSSIVDGRYAAATGSHRATGGGQDVLSPRAIADGVLGQLNTSVLITLPRYLVTGPAGTAPGPRAGSGRRSIQAGQRGTWYLGAALRIVAVTVPDAHAATDAASGFRIGLLTPSGQIRWLAARAVTRTSLAVRLPRPVTAVALTGRAGRRQADLGAPALTEADGRVVVANGVLQTALTPPQWAYATSDGPFAVFADRDASGALTVSSLDGGPAPAGAKARTLSGAASEPAIVAVQSSRGVRITRSVADIPGWTATWQPATGPACSLAVHRAGLVQAVDVPAGRGILTWRYSPPLGAAGLALSLVALSLLALLLIVATASYPRLARRPDTAGPARTGSAAGLPASDRGRAGRRPARAPCRSRRRRPGW